MSQTLNTFASPPSNLSIRTLNAIGALGTLLALAILGASILLRLTSEIAADGTVHSTLASELENMVRLVHRLAAASVGLMAVLVTALGWMQRGVAPPQATKAIMWLVAATVLLAVIGPLTPGYRYNSVTIANVVAGTVLLGACWWLREVLSFGPPAPHAVAHPMLRMAFAVLVVHVGLGAAASALEMRGTHWVAFVHAGTGMFMALLLGSILWDRRSHARLTGVVRTMVVLLILQLLLGVVSLWVAGRPVSVGFVHAMLSALLAAGLVSIAVRENATGPHNRQEV